MAKQEFIVHDASPDDGSSSYDNDSVVSASVPEKFRGTASDMRDMRILGKKQVLRRNFNATTMIGFASMVMVAWEAVLVVIRYPLVDGGAACAFWGSILAPIGLSFVYMSLSELASMSPTAGGQYHWVSEFSPPKYQKPLSYLTGWLIALGWQTWLAGTCFMAGTVLQGLIALNEPDYAWKNWQGTLLVAGIVVFSALFNTVFANRLPFIQGILLVVHLLGIFAIIAPLWALAPIGNPREVLLVFVDNGNWGSVGLATVIGMPVMIAMLYGFDSNVHMSEEIEDASRVVPPTIMWAMWSNAILLIIMVVTFIFTLGDLEEILRSPIGVPFIQVFLNMTKSYAATNVMTILIATMLIAACCSEVATTSRQLWSFARDKGVPFSNWLAKVTPGWNIPLNSVLFSLAFTTLLALINIGSDEAMYAINSLSTLAIVFSYIMTISCLIWRRLYGEPLPERRWSLGRWGLPINIIAVCFLTPIAIFNSWPLRQPVNLLNMNWSAVIFVGVLVVSGLHYVLKGRHVYIGPVLLVKRDL